MKNLEEIPQESEEEGQDSFEKLYDTIRETAAAEAKNADEAQGLYEKANAVIGKIEDWRKIVKEPGKRSKRALSEALVHEEWLPDNTEDRIKELLNEEESNAQAA